MDKVEVEIKNLSDSRDSIGQKNTCVGNLSDRTSLKDKIWFLKERMSNRESLMDKVEGKTKNLSDSRASIGQKNT